jgi:carboxyl-terminal processing protease
MKRLVETLSLAGLAALLLITAFGAGYYARALVAENQALALPVPGLQQPDPYPLLAEARGILEAHYSGVLPDDKTLEYGAVRGLVNAVGDPYTVFVEPPTHELESQSLQGEYGGIGVEIKKNDAGEIVLFPYRDSPAALAGLVEGDVLLAVDSTRVTAAVALDEAAALLRGLVGTSVTVQVRHPSGEIVAVTLTRQSILIPSVTWRIVEGQPAIGLIAISRFSDKTPDEVGQAADELRAEGATQFILDLRNNGGGILESAVEVAGRFLDGGVVMYETQRNASEKVYRAPAAVGPLAQAPLAVLVNHGTASAAEIVAGALLDRGRAPLIGQTTFGKGSVQLVFELSDKSSLHVTAYLWYTPARRALDQVGLPPTLPVEPAGDGADAELARAIEYLQNGQ